MSENDLKIGWSELPPELLMLISKRLNMSRLCTLRFRAVCRSWRSSCPYPPNMNILSPYLPRTSGRGSVVASAVLIIEPLGGKGCTLKPGCWVVVVDEFEPGRLSIRYPMSKYRVIEPVEGSFEVLNVMDFRVTEVMMWCSLKPYDTQSVFCWNLGMDKVMLLPDLDLSKDSRYAILHENGGMNVFNYFQQRRGSVVHSITRPRFEDIVKFNGKIYGINRRGRVYAIDFETLEMIKISGPIPRGVSKRRKRLVESEGDLYLVAMQKKEVGDCLRLKVYKLSEKDGKWIEVRSLNNRAFFIGAECSFTVPAEAYGLQGNCIFTYGNSFRKYRSLVGRGDHFDIRDRHSSEHWIGVFHLENGGHFGPMDSCDVLWPPPPWLVPNSRVSVSEASVGAGGTDEGDLKD